MRTAVALTAVLAIALGCLFSQGSAAKSKTWTVTERLEQLSKDIDKGEKSGELTAKEAKALREDSVDISNRMAKMKVENNGKLSAADNNKLEKMLNKLSLRIQKLELNKRVK